MQHLITLITAGTEASAIINSRDFYCSITFEPERLPLHKTNVNRKTAGPDLEGA